jgi:hypothetical protein
MTSTPTDPRLDEILRLLSTHDRDSRPFCNRSVVAHLALMLAAFLAGVIVARTPVPGPLPPREILLERAGGPLEPPPDLVLPAGQP